MNTFSQSSIIEPAARFCTFESLEARQFMSATGFSQATVLSASVAPINQPLSTTPKLAATTSTFATVKPAVTLRAAVASRTPVSIVTIRNTTPNVVNYQVAWQNQTSYTTYTVQPNTSRLIWQSGQVQSATIRYDASFMPGFQGQVYSLASKPFVMGGREGWTPKAANDGMVYSFGLNAGKSGLTLAGNYAVDVQRHPSLRGTVTKFFPGFRGSFEILGPSTPADSASRDTYNCIAWSLGITSRWVWPGESLGAFDQLYGQHGYRRLARADFSLQRGVQKIALYALNGEMTHAAKQNTDGTWSSKLGSAPLIRHNLVDAFGNSDYGRPVAVYVKAA